MKLFKKAVAGIMCACMLFSGSGITSLAMEDDSDIVEITEENLATDTDAVTDVSDEDLVTDDLSDEDADLEAETEEDIDSEEIEDEVDEPLLNYIVIENDYVETPSTQYVVASIGEDGTSVDSATLNYINQTTGVTYQKNSDKIVDSAILFNLNFPDTSYNGQYKLVSIEFAYEDNTYNIDLEEIGLTSIFGVNTVVDANPEGWLVDEESDDNSNVEGLITDADGNAITSGELAQAIAEVGTDGLNKASNGDMIIVLDPGHGGSDTGATRTHNGVTYYERDCNLKIAQACKAELEKYAGVTVYMTRYDNSTKPSLTERAEIAKKYNADVLISIHNNSSTSADSRGSEVWVPNSSSYNYYAHTTGEELAGQILSELSSLGLNKRGVYTRNATDGDTYPTGDTSDYYTVINESRRRGIPAIIVEHAFVSNPSDASNYLGSDAKLTALGVADANAIVDYFGLSTDPNVYGGVDYSAVYDFDYYVAKYPDVAKKYGESKRDVLKYFIETGMSLGHQASEEFNVSYYKNRYVDLRNAYGSDLKKYYIHYINLGKNEGRDGKTPCKNVVGGVTKYNGIDYSAVYNYNYYINKYPDIKAAFKDDDVKALAHFVNCGMNEARQGCETFNVYSYAYTYADLRKVYKNDLKKYYLHYINAGKNEGRKAIGVTSMMNTATIYNGINYSSVYDYNYYTTKYLDIKKAYGLDDVGALKHFVNCGMKEKRQGNSEFNVTYYKNRYVDLRNAYGTDTTKYYMHYINAGKTEKRDAKTTCNTIKGYVTKYNGVDYSAVYDFNYYQSKYSDIKKAFGDDDVKTLQHFVGSGMIEGRQAKEEFNVIYYKNRYADLRNKYGTDLKKYYLDYIESGKKEGRDGKTYTEQIGGITVYNGVDYSAVYDFDYYQSKNADIKKAYGNDDVSTLAHFVNRGMLEGRQAKAEFNVNYYKANYVDLAKQYGTDLKKYYMHYINTGKSAGWIADRLILDTIMGTTNTNVSQMVAYYNANATYPAFYAGTDAPTINALCQIYIEECAAEGVRAEVAFCQAMKETGFLRFGGQVSISQLNFAGLGATDGGAAGASFSSVRQGVRAQVQHLKAYASTDALKNSCVDPRFSLVTRGTAPYIVWLGIQENPYGKGWATAKNYGYSIINDYMAKLAKY